MDYILAHHGIKGMKWGVRRTPAQLGHRPSSKGKRGNTQESDSHEDYKRARSKSTKQMSDKELREALNRLRMEDEYKRLNPNSISRGQKIVKTALAATISVSTAAATAITLKSQYKTIRSWFDHSGNG